MIRAGVIGHLILNDLDAHGMGLVDQFAELVERAEVLLDGIVVHGAVSVVVGDGAVAIGFAFVAAVGVVVDGSEPERGDAERFQVGQVLDDAFAIAAMVVAALGTIVQAAAHWRIVVGWIAVRKTVGHDQVDHVVGRETLEAAGAVERGNNRERSLGVAARGTNLDGD